MTTVLGKNSVGIKNNDKNDFDILPEENSQLVAFCPVCKALETLYFASDCLIETRKFSQGNGKVYHDCGSREPCRLYHFT